jgi:hypothetical protein
MAADPDAPPTAPSLTAVVKRLRQASAPPSLHEVSALLGRTLAAVRLAHLLYRLDPAGYARTAATIDVRDWRTMGRMLEAFAEVASSWYGPVELAFDDLADPESLESTLLGGVELYWRGVGYSDQEEVFANEPLMTLLEPWSAWDASDWGAVKGHALKYGWSLDHLPGDPGVVVTPGLLRSLWSDLEPPLDDAWRLLALVTLDTGNVLLDYNWESGVNHAAEWTLHNLQVLGHEERCADLFERRVEAVVQYTAERRWSVHRLAARLFRFMGANRVRGHEGDDQWNRTEDLVWLGVQQLALGGDASAPPPKAVRKAKAAIERTRRLHREQTEAIRRHQARVHEPILHHPPGD